MKGLVGGFQSVGGLWPGSMGPLNPAMYTSSIEIMCDSKLLRFFRKSHFCILATKSEIQDGGGNMHREKPIFICCKVPVYNI